LAIHGMEQILYRQRLIFLSVVFAIALVACETTRTNTPVKVKNNALTRCNTIQQCERAAND
jgi:hypothetical protein